MPIKSWVDVKSVAIGEVVYVGGSTAGGNRDDSCTIIKFSIRENEWKVLPFYRATDFAMVCFLDQLVLVGGLDPLNGNVVDYIAVFDHSVNKWIHPYSPLNIPRYDSTVISDNQSIVVAGGWMYKRQRTASVEVFDYTSNMWFVADPLPIPRSAAKSSVLGNSLYIMGGFDDIKSYRAVHKVAFKELINKAKNGKGDVDSEKQQDSLWETIEMTPCGRCAAVSIQCHLLAVGGYDQQYRSSSSVHLYQSHTRGWVKVGDLPAAQHGSTCSVLPNGEFVVIGGFGVSRVDFMSLS